MFILHGYLIPASCNIFPFTEQVREIIKKECQNVYNELLAEEIVEIVDEITLGITNINEGFTIFSAAVERLNNKIARSSVSNTITEYNFRTNLYIYEFEGKYYAELDTVQKTFAEEVKNNVNTADYIGFEEMERTTNSQISDTILLWQKIRKAYSEGKEPFVCKICPTKDIFSKPSFEELKFPKKKDRACSVALHQLENELLTQYSLGEKIEPYQLMPLMDKVLTRVVEDDMQDRQTVLIKEIETKLVDITESLIYTPYSKKVK